MAITFNGTNISTISFNNTDISTVTFNGTSWGNGSSSWHVIGEVRNYAEFIQSFSA